MRGHAPLCARPEDLLLGDEREPIGRQREALGEIGDADLDAPGRRPAPARARLGLDRRGDLIVGEQPAQALGVRERARREHDPVARGAPLGDPARERRERGLARPRARERRAQLGVTARRDREPLDAVGRIGEVDLLEDQRAARERFAFECVGSERDLGRRAHEPPAAARELVVLERFLGIAQHALPAGLEIVDHHERVFGQEVEHGLGAGQEQRRERLGARRHVPAQQRIDQLVDRARRHALARAERAQRLGALDHERAVGQQVARRRRHHVSERRLAALARRIELADRLHLVAEQLDPHRRGAMGRKHVEDPAAHGELAALLDERHPRITRADQRRDERVAVDRLPELEVHGAPAHELARGHARRERGPRRHDDRRRLRRGRQADSRASGRARPCAARPRTAAARSARRAACRSAGTRAAARRRAFRRARTRDPTRTRRRPWPWARSRAPADRRARARAAPPTPRARRRAARRSASRGGARADPRRGRPCSASRPILSPTGSRRSPRLLRVHSTHESPDTAHRGWGCEAS